MSEANPVILSFYQATLLPIVNTVSTKWNSGDYIGAFHSLKMEYTWMPNVCMKECEPEYLKTLRTVEAIRNRFIEVDLVTQRAKIGIATREFLYGEVLRLSALFHDSLDRNKYLEKEGTHPKFKGKKHLGSAFFAFRIFCFLSNKKVKKHSSNNLHFENRRSLHKF